MANREIGVPVLVGYLALWWGGVAGVCYWLTINHAPLAPELKWKEEPIVTTTKMVVVISKPAADPDTAAEVNYTYSWTVDGKPVEGQIGESIDSKLTTKGQVWEVSVEPDDGSKGGWLCALPWHECAGKIAAKLTVTIGDSAPRSRIVFRVPDPTGATAGTVTKVFDGKTDVTPEMSCADSDASEANAAAAALLPEGTPIPDPATLPDPCTYTFKWFPVSDTPLPADAPPAYTDKTLPKDAWKKADAWRLVTVANDGELDGPEVEETIRKQ